MDINISLVSIYQWSIGIHGMQAEDEEGNDLQVVVIGFLLFNIEISFEV